MASIAAGGAGVVIASMAGHLVGALPADQERALATTPTDELLSLPFLAPDVVTDPGFAYSVAKRANLLRVAAESLTWGRRGARLNSISPGVISTAMGRSELSGPHGAGMRAMVEASGTGRLGTAADIAAAATFLLSDDASFVTGTDLPGRRGRRRHHPVGVASGNMSPVPDISLNNGSTIPQLGFGVFQIEPDDTAAAVRTALEIGYRHIDTAEMYGNEKEVGQGIRDAGIARDQVYVTSKLNNGFHRPDDARRAFDGTLTALDSDYVDLFLIHWPLPTRYDGDFVSTWNVLEEFAGDGRARSIGVSNFTPTQLDKLAAGIPNRAGRQPDRGAPVLRQRHRARLRPGARHRHRGVVADRAGPGARRPRGHEDCCGAWKVTRTGGATLAHPTRGHRVPEVGVARPDRRRTSSCSTSTSMATRWPRSRVWTGARPAAADRTPTSST